MTAITTKPSVPSQNAAITSARDELGNRDCHAKSSSERFSTLLRAFKQQPIGKAVKSVKCNGSI